jgi:hypothetical protein
MVMAGYGMKKVSFAADRLAKIWFERPEHVMFTDKHELNDLDVSLILVDLGIAASANAY